MSGLSRCIRSLTRPPAHLKRYTQFKIPPFEIIKFIMIYSQFKNMKYKHTQIGYLTIFTLSATSVLFGIILIQNNFNPLILAFMFFILVILASLLSLNVIIDKNHIQIKFGYGIYKKRFVLKEIISVRVVKNHWYYGWGIRIWFWPYMLIYNISGFDAVEITMKNGKIYRIGTDEPKKLERAVLQLIE